MLLLTRFKVYLGDCAAPAFLRHIQELLEPREAPACGQSQIATLSNLEEVSLNDGETKFHEGPGRLLELKELVDVFFTSVSGAAYCLFPQLMHGPRPVDLWTF